MGMFTNLGMYIPDFGYAHYDKYMNQNLKVMDFIGKNGLNQSRDIAVTDGGGLNINWSAGTAEIERTNHSVNASNGALTDNIADTTYKLANFVYVNNFGVVAITTTLPTTAYTALAIIYTDQGDIDTLIDVRFRTQKTHDGDLIVTGNVIIQGTTTTIDSTVLNVEDANITLNKGGNQASADDIAGLSIEMSDTADVKLIYDKDVASKWRIGLVGAEKEVADVSSVQIFTNKRLNSLKINSDTVLTATSSQLNELKNGGNTALHKHTLANGATDVTASAAELNKLDGANANVTAGNLNTLTGGGNTALHKHTLANGATDVTASAAELNKLDGANANVTAGNLNTLTGGGSTALHSHAYLAVDRYVLYNNHETFTVPAGITKIFVTACAGGGGGGRGSTQAHEGGGGGGGGQAVISYPITVTPLEEIYVVIGTGGIGGVGAEATNGNVTILTGYLTLTGGSKGSNGIGGGTGGLGPGKIAGSGGGASTAGEDSLLYFGGSSGTNYGGGGGGGIFGDGGAGGVYNGGNGVAAAVNTGAGGGGGAPNGDGANGGSGKVLIRW